MVDKQPCVEEGSIRDRVRKPKESRKKKGTLKF